MSAVALAIGTAVAGIGGGLIASGGAKSAANAQVQASQDANAAQERMYAKQVALQEPFRQAGLTAQNRYMELLGLGAPSTTASSTNPQDYGLSIINMPDDTGMGYGYGGIQYVDQQGNPVSDVNAYMAAHAPAAAPASSDFGKYTKDFSMADYQADPGYQFRLDEGQKALERSAAARGLLASGSTLKGIQRFAQGEASQEYTNAFNRYQVNRSNQLNPLQSLMGAGQSATNTLTGAAGQQGQNQATNLINAGQARASGYVGSANALSSAVGGIGNSMMQYGMMRNTGGLMGVAGSNIGYGAASGLSSSINSAMAANPGIF